MLANEQTFQFGQAKLKARDSLRFTMRQSSDDVTYLVENEATAKFFQIGLPQYTFLSLLNGRRTISQALMQTATILRINALDEQEAANLCKWAIESGLVESEKSRNVSRKEHAEDMAMRKSASLLNPITLRMPFFNPDSLLETMTRYLGWLVSFGGAMLWIIVVVAGFFQLMKHWDAFVLNRVNSFSADDLLWIAVAWLALKLLHESAHGIACKRFGGQVHSCGMLLLLLIPLPYVDVTSSWRFINKWHRILVAAAGMMVEVFVAAIACVVWVSAEPGPLKYHAGNIIITATLHTLIFNANPLMKFDGYYMLSDFLEIPNLATRGRSYLKSVFKWLYFGNKPKPITDVGIRGVIVKAYGFLAMAWFFSISLGLSLAASSMFEGFGLLIAVVGMILWFGIPVIKFAKFVLLGSKTEEPNRIWFAAAMSITCVLIGAFLFACPSPSVVSAPIVIDFEELSIVRAEAAGFAQTIHVVDGQKVEAGQLLITMENRDLKTELESLWVDVEIGELRCKTYHTSGDIAALKLERSSLQSMYDREAELATLVKKLEVVAPQSGVVMASDLSAKENTYLQPGDEVLSIAMSDQLQAVALTRQQDVEWIEKTQAKNVQLFVWGQDEQQLSPGKITRVFPRARDDFPHEAFAASNGGPLAVVPRNQVERSSDSGEDEQSLMLTEPRVQVEIALSEEDRQRLLPGQSGTMLIRSRDEKMGPYLASNFLRFIRKNSFRSHGL